MPSAKEMHFKYSRHNEADNDVAQRLTCREWPPSEFVLLLKNCVSILYAAWQRRNCPFSLTS
jgi:hypothetical protein